MKASLFSPNTATGSRPRLLSKSSCLPVPRFGRGS
jgi:hypothetical protein